MVVQQWNYVSTQKAHYFKHMLIWSLAVAGIYLIGLIAFGKKENYGTVVAGVLVMGVALNLSRLVGFSKFHNAKESYKNCLEQLKEGVQIFHCAIIPDVKESAFFEHIIVTSEEIYLICYEEKALKRYRLWLENKLMNKGFTLEQIKWQVVASEEEVEVLCKAIHQAALNVNEEKINENARIINELLM